ncbi:uncharacterized protein LOC128206462 [Mya arenaria]|uniref:uncharacterized protein LOC128206462 n=1 Tax=Mya arenaria TaxID=6604 RepID=UPI0022DF90E5|nr:uncharacterized protein LOC128206462 [Mya arenaria]
MTAISLVTEKQPTDKECGVQEKSRRFVLERKCIMGTFLGFLLVGMLAAAIYVSAVITTNHKKGDMEKNNQQGKAYVSAERVQEFVSCNTRSHVVQIRVPDQGIVFIDFERRLKILTFSHIKHVCFVAEITDMATEPLSHTDVESNFTMAVKGTPVADVYVADVTYDVKRLPEVTQHICKVAFHAKRKTNSEPVRTDRRKKRQCGQSCIMVCDPRTHRCRRQCVRNPCPRRCTRERPCSV